ncbi:MAG TPA: PilT/PilU family type 4a pilus ATPase [Polyangia bacterium]|jgi:twitching motility protein PilT
MAAIDGLIALLDSQRADGLVLAAGKAPALTFGGAQRALTMPALDEGALLALVSDIITPDKKSALDAHGAAELAYASPKAGPVTIHASRPGGALMLRITRGGAAAPAARRPEHEPLLTPAAVRAEPPREAPRHLEPTRESPAVALSPGDSELWPVLRQALRRGASDILLATGAAPAIRLGGEMVELPAAPPTRDELLGLFAAALSPVHRQQLDATGSVDFAFEAAAAELGQPSGRRFRANLFTHLGGLTAALRPLWETVPALEELHLPPRLLGLVGAPSGMVLFAGLAGSGKSTTLAVLIEHVNETRARHIVTLEDPIEYVFRRQRSVIHQREVGTHVDSFASGLRAALRESPDVILVGEMRDRETIALALTAAETGHLVLSTMHSANAATAVDRIVDVFPEHQQGQVRSQLANVLQTIVTQRLLPGREPGTRVPVLEILYVNHAVASHIREGKTHMIPNQMQVGADDAMLPYDRALVDLARRGLIAPQTAEEHARDEDFVHGALRSGR